MDVGFKNPLHHKALLTDKINNGIGRNSGCAAGVEVKIQHAVYNGATLLGIVADQTTYVQVAVTGSKNPRTLGADMANSFAKKLG